MSSPLFLLVSFFIILKLISGLPFTERSVLKQVQPLLLNCCEGRGLKFYITKYSSFIQSKGHAFYKFKRSQ